MKENNKLYECYESVRIILKTDNISVSDYKLIEYGLQFIVSILDWSGIIRIYQNKKGALKIDYSQLKNSANSIKIRNLIEGKEIQIDQQLHFYNPLLKEFPLLPLHGPMQVKYSDSSSL